MSADGPPRPRLRPTGPEGAPSVFAADEQSGRAVDVATKLERPYGVRINTVPDGSDTGV